METEWKQILQDSGITEDLQLGRENVSGLKGKLSKNLECYIGKNDNLLFPKNIFILP